MMRRRGCAAGHVAADCPEEESDEQERQRQRDPADAARRQIERSFQNALPALRRLFMDADMPNEMLERKRRLPGDFDLVGQLFFLAVAFGQFVGRLQALGVLGPRVSLAHGVWLDDAELAAVAAAGATIVHNPASNLKLGNGVARLRADLESGAWEARHADLLERETLDVGCRLVIAESGG